MENQRVSQEMMNHTEMKTYLITSLKVAAACILIWYLFKSGRLRTENLLRLLHSESLPILIPSAIAFLFSQLLSSIRIRFLLEVIEVRINFIPIFKLTMIGNFFNLVIPGTVGGDIVKGFYLTRHESNSKGRSSGIVVIDRVVGLIALSFFGFVSVIYIAWKYGFLFFPHHYELWAIIALSFVPIVSFVGVILICKYEPIRQRLRRFVLKVFPKGFIHNGIEGLVLITKKWRYIFYSFLISILVQGLSLAGLLNLVNLIGEDLPDLIALVAVSSLVMLMGIIPLTPGNIGWTELLATFGWAAVGTKGGADVFLSWRVITILCSLAGGLFYLFPARSCHNNRKGAQDTI